jgi:Zn-dependent peptidase ImmA (M78 family)/DNA-binding XRE family transcriptional regulator
VSEPTPPRDRLELTAPSIGEVVREQRVLAGLTQRQLGEVVGASFTHISKIEAGKEVPSADLLRQIAHAVGGDAEELLLAARRVPEELGQVVVDKPNIAPRFLRSWGEGRISDEDVERLLKKSGVGGKPVFPRSLHRHEQKAAEVLARYAKSSGWKPSLPIPIEHVIEAMGLKILWEPLEEPAGERILGALDPNTRTIHLNEHHLRLFGDVIGPEPFTLSHELGHWLYDADDPDQLTLLDGVEGRILCRGIRQVHLTEQARIREVNANRFAASLLLPRDLVVAQVGEPISTEEQLKATARNWGVSRQTLEIRLRQMGRADLLPTLG